MNNQLKISLLFILFLLSGCSHDSTEHKESNSKQVAELEAAVKQLKAENSKLKAENAKLLKESYLTKKRIHNN